MDSSACSVTTVLLVEDSHDDEFIFRHSMRKTGQPVVVHSVRSATDAIAYLKGETPYSDRTAFPYPEVIFTDLDLGTGTGLGLLKWIRAHTRPGSLFTIVLSGSQMPSGLEEAYALGAQAVILKTGVLTGLADILNAAMKFFALCERLRPSEPSYLPGQRRLQS